MPWVLFFDGDCGLCNRSVRRLIRWDEKGVIHYASLQGELAKCHDLRRYLEEDNASVVLLDQESGQVFTHGDCLLQIFRLLGGAWRLLLVIVMVPRSWRNWAYRQIARNRHRFAGKEPRSCEVPDERLHSRIID